MSKLQSPEEPTMESAPERPETEPAAGKGKTVMVLMIIAAIGLVIFYNYLMKLNTQDKENPDRPGIVGKIDKGVALVSAGGSELNFRDLEQKIIVANLLSTEDPKAIDFLENVQAQFRRDLRVHILSLAADPESETPEVLNKWKSENDIKGSNWWVTTGDSDSIKAFVTRQLKLRGVKKVDGKVEEYDRRVVLIDTEGQIRGYYDVAHPDNELAEGEKVKFQRAISWLVGQGMRVLAKVDEGVTLTERSGEQVNTADLDGKIRLVAYVYTRCPNGCAGVVDYMKELNAEFGDDPRLHLMSLSLDPEHDTPKVLEDWASLHEVEGDNWWFLTGAEDQLKKLANMIGFAETKIIPVEKRNSELDIFDHDMGIAIIDSKNQVRGKYEVMGDSFDEARDWLEDDLRVLLGRPKKSD